MIALGIYLSKVTLCSGFLYLYYLLVLKNRQFHQYNRFYLLLIASISWLVPLIKIDLSQQAIPAAPVAYEIVQVIAAGNSDFAQITETATVSLNWSLLILFLMIAVSVLILSGVIYSFLKIYRLLKTYPCSRLQRARLIMTDVKGTPFSFFNLIFWHKAIDLKSEVGQQMLAHEMVHVNEKHSSDKLFMECIMIIGWYNPVLWLLKKELYLIHEFIADQKSIENRDASTLASLLLIAAYPQQQNSLSNPFFFSPIKRRIAMLTNPTNSRASYMRRLLVLPLLSLLILFFAFRAIDQSERKNENILDKKYTILIDVAHGGTMNGAISQNGGKEIEKDLCLSISKKLKELNKNPELELVFTRESDVMVGHEQRVQLATEVKADLLISLHVNAATTPVKKGLEFYIPKVSNPYYKESLQLGSVMNYYMKGIFSNNRIKTRNEGIYILDKAPCPALLVETGYLTNASDLDIIKNRQDEIAVKLLEGLKAYLSTAKTKQIPEQKPVSKIENERTRLYEQLVSEFCKKEINGNDTIYKGTIPVERQRQIDSLYAKMSKEERQQCFLILMMRSAPILKPNVPSAADFERFKNAGVYGIWVDGKHLPNTELLKYNNTDFANYFTSKLYGAAQKGRKYSIQVNLETKGYYEKINKEKGQSKFRWFEVRMRHPWVKVIS